MVNWKLHYNASERTPCLSNDTSDANSLIVYFQVRFVNIYTERRLD